MPLKIFLMVYTVGFIILLSIQRTKGIGTDNFIYLWAPVMGMNIRGSLMEVNRLLPMSDKEFKMWLVLREIAASLPAALLVAIVSIPYAVREGNAGILFRILFAVLGIAVWSNGCSIKYGKKKYPGLLFWFVTLICFVVTGMALVSDMEISGGSAAYIYILLAVTEVLEIIGYVCIRIYMIRKIPIQEMVLGTELKKRGNHD